MHRLREFYYSNKAMIWRIASIIVFFFVLIQLINYMVARRNANNVGKIPVTNSNVINTNSTNSDNNTNIVFKDKNNSNNYNSIIESFITACNNKEIEVAYGYISEDCKRELYPSIELFKEKYVDYIFNGSIKKISMIENWSGNIYKVDFKEDMMITGNKNEQSIQDYIAVVNQDGQTKLNVNNFFGTKKIGRTTTKYNIEMTVESKNVYKDYEEYTIKVKNNSENTILLDTQEDTKSIYLRDRNNIKYYSYSHEIVSNLLKIDSGYSNQIKIKFAKTYNSATPTSIVFSNLILNYNQYLDGNTEKQEFILNI